MFLLTVRQISLYCINDNVYQIVCLVHEKGESADIQNTWHTLVHPNLTLHQIIPNNYAAFTD